MLNHTPSNPRTPRNRRASSLIAIALAAASPLLLAGCDTTDTQRTSLRQGFTLYNQRQVDESEAIATRFIETNPTSPNIDEAYYLRGLSRLTRGGADTRPAAASDLKLAIEKSSRPDLKAKANRALGDIDFEANRWAPAMDAYKKSLTDNSDAKAVTYLNYRIGACLQDQGQWDQADTWFERVAAADNDAYLTERTVSRMHARNFSLQFGAFAEKSNAADLLAQLKTAQINAQVAIESRDGKPMYLVRYGSYRNWQEADAARDNYQAKYPLVAIVP